MGSRTTDNWHLAALAGRVVLVAETLVHHVREPEATPQENTHLAVLTYAVSILNSNLIANQFTEYSDKIGQYCVLDLEFKGPSLVVRKKSGGRADDGRLFAMLLDLVFDYARYKPAKHEDARKSSMSTTVS
jgi:hypothetical protein